MLVWITLYVFYVYFLVRIGTCFVKLEFIDAYKFRYDFIAVIFQKRQKKEEALFFRFSFVTLVTISCYNGRK